MLLLSPLGERHDPSFEQTWIPYKQECIMPVWLKLAQSRSGEEEEKFTMTMTTYNRQILSEKLT